MALVSKLLETNDQVGGFDIAFVVRQIPPPAAPTSSTQPPLAVQEEPTWASAWMRPEVT
jgi:hypothetical protein